MKRVQLVLVSKIFCNLYLIRLDRLIKLFCCYETKIVEKGKVFNFQNSFRPHSHLWSQILGTDRKSAITSASVEMSFLR